MKKLRGAEAPPQISTENNLGRPFGGANEAVAAADPTHHREYRLSSPPQQPSSFGAQNPANSSQPLAIFNSCSAEPYKFTGEIVPFFTSTQLIELERQAMIYKYMISSLPVPYHLLYPPISSMYSVGYSRNGASMEPGRCKRTDGKKWRCSRDVAPHQKYCERHLHRSRPRSRKPVELDNNSSIINGDESLKKPRLEMKFDTSGVSTEPYNRDVGLIMENDAYPNKGSSSVYIPNDLSNQDYSSNQVDHQMPTFSDFPIDLVSAWSIDNLNGNSNNNLNNYSSLPADSEDFSPWLNLSMGLAGRPALDQEIGDAVEFCDENVRWPGPVCYSDPFGPGGPLAEALGPNPTSPHDSVSGLGTAVSSPSGVIQRTLFSQSDGSVCNSPLEIGLPKIK
ncbi:Growth-regulating factor 7 [Striga hermonthica]|uniref:Growth-regulating factor n=1 Tax=Striga hermonthica TaxID=68872 RepID=A0A9N7RBS3_STRHE|nr:Growth-regulating factor 7 [Striga hermonthica]